MNLKDNLSTRLSRRILILDGAMGSMIQTFNLTEKDFRGERFASSDRMMKGNNDMLSITRPDIIKSIHAQYLDAGADIIETNSFSSNAISMEDYGLQDCIRELNVASVKVAREAVDEYLLKHPGKPRFVAGSVGPTTKSTSMSPDVSNPALRAVSFDDMRMAYKEQIAALVDAGADALLIETVYDTLNAKAAIFAAEEVLEAAGKNVPIMLSVTVSDKGGRMLAGQTLTAFLASVQHANILSVGLNCSFGASDMKPFLKELGAEAPCYISAYPNAGLPNRFGEYDETPEKMAAQIREYIDEGLVNIIGGCCGTTPAHIATYRAMVDGATPRRPAAKPDCLWLSGLERLEVRPENNFLIIGERCNVAGSRKFLRLIRDRQYEEALSIARKQVENGAQVLDINMDDGMLDAREEMTVFLNLIASEPDIARVPLMIDSSSWDVIEAGLKCVQGKSIVNSISLKEGEEKFLHCARLIRRYGAAALVMAFDEAGQADTYERRTEICARAYHLLVEKAGFNPQDIIFDPNVLAIATGMEEHCNYAVDFIHTVHWIRQHLPGARISGGVSNLSFSFRGNSYIREAIHSVFLYHAIREGMDMGIVNPSEAIPYEEIPIDVRTLVEDAVLNRHPDATDLLIRKAEALKESAPLAGPGAGGDAQAWRSAPLEQRLEHALVKGIGDFLEEDLAEALRKYPRAIDIIDRVLMAGMNRVGSLFGEGKMFLPQVVKTARTMKKAVAVLQPAIEAEKSEGDARSAGRMLLATVKGDVHDIGKNIVSVVMACNNYEIIDLGVMTPAEEIVRRAQEIRPDIIGLSGLITPSLEEMCHVAEALEKAGLDIPLFIGGATTSRLHTAVRIAPRYSHPVVHVKDASQSAIAAAGILHPDTKAAYAGEIKKEYDALRDSFSSKRDTLLPLADARKNRMPVDWAQAEDCPPKQSGTHVLDSIPVEEVIPFINWNYFFVAWKLTGKFGDLVRMAHCDACRTQWLASFPEKEKEKAAEALQLYLDAQHMLDVLATRLPGLIRAVYGFFEANAEDEAILLHGLRLPMLRRQAEKEAGYYHSLADFIRPASSGKKDFLGAFTVTAGCGIEALLEKYRSEGNDYHALLLKSLCDRLAEAASEYLHYKVRTDYWGYAPGEPLDVSEILKAHYQGIRPAVGYSSIPDQSINFDIHALLDMGRIGVSLTEHGAMYPTASVSGFYFARPEAAYFTVGRITEEQLQHYASLRGITKEEAGKWLGMLLG
ncbi:MAG: methionine synthase [Tannerella sp.]|jgi:5-methyltetrahydrofolate--homocysteine methyltransferase|nr:methionine synthase [Tannerella sp.]